MAEKTSLFGSIRNRLLFGTVALATLPLIILAIVVGYFATHQAGQSLTERAYDQMQSIRVGKEEEIRAYFDNIADTMTVFSQSQEVIKALREMPSAYQSLNAEAGIDMAAARERLTEYYKKEFGDQYLLRNPGSNADISQIVTSLPDSTIASQYLYIGNNPNPLSEKGKLDRASDNSAYSVLHAQIHPVGRRAVERYGLYDFFLIDMQGNLVYTFFKELDFGTNLLDGPWAKTGLGQSYAAAREGKKLGEISITDYAPYRPSYDDQASFVSTPVFDGNTQIGVLLVQLPIDRVNQIMTFGGNWKDVGLGQSGEVYLVGPDKTPRSVSRFITEDTAGFISLMQGIENNPDRINSMTVRKTNIGEMTVDTLGVNEALSGKSGTSVYSDYRNLAVLGSYAPIDVLGLRWAIVSEIDKQEADLPITALTRQIAQTALATLGIMVLLGIFVALRLARSINKPLTHFTDVVQRVGAGDNNVRVRLPPNDEIGQLGQSFDGMLDERIATQLRIERENEDLNNSVVEIMTAVAELANRNLSIKVPVSENVTGAVSDAINLMTRSTVTALGKVRNISDTVSVRSDSVRQRSDQVRDVANAASDQATAASQELQQTAMALRKMGEQASNANAQAEQAIRATGDALEIVRATVNGISSSRDQIRETEKRVKRLGERSQEISSIVNIISQIAERTSVLALNASMQAVAAGEAGRGFAVVADEVKRLAENARQATQQISSLVGAIQADTTETIQAMNATITQVVDISRLADQAGGQMSETRTATEQLVLAVREIASSTQIQNQASQTLLTRAYDLIQASQRTIDELEAQRGDTEILASSATELVSTVSQFRLPA